jgi:hypothetical protein
MMSDLHAFGYLFRDLDDEEIADFKQYARDNYNIGDDIKGIWHPVVQRECTLMNEEKPEC